MKDISKIEIAVIGLGYVGLPLAVEFGKKRSVVGFDIDKRRIEELNDGIDKTLEISKREIEDSKNLTFTSEVNDLKKCNFFIVTVPTPIDEDNQPDLNPLLKASTLIGSLIKRGDIVVFESTVYPGATEEECVPILEKESSLKFNQDFFVGYSPERINPGDKEHTLTKIIKVTSGSSPESSVLIDNVYSEIIEAGTHRASSIKVAEAAKVIENTQRDLNIALINELAIIFDKMSLDTSEVLEAAQTKWNFLPFKPGLVGGHCIGVDPYYLTYKSRLLGYLPEVILSGRKLNDQMGIYVANKFIQCLTERHAKLTSNLKVLILGITFKENCPDLRNNKTIDIYKYLKEKGLTVEVYDPWASPKETQDLYGFKLIEYPAIDQYEGILISVSHDQFIKMGVDEIRSFGKNDHILYDLKNIFQVEDSDIRL
ncbi:MAG: Vi polysaccharide biosynthesis UDP-N-acetylglucosamine C-6 dehydrogenase TviB [Gammaproteobacteria bacterium]|nr:Vi polysaccharide biosynthesis UDP-N-acetylglucosamine C-6 dehydrogenase TviB [Gammaproteobacteria bacterium]|tara:strand:- start:18536 stop:19816 length:1281 start_codon:yes stop_codon:yes gene_type:complete